MPKPVDPGAVHRPGCRSQTQKAPSEDGAERTVEIVRARWLTWGWRRQTSNAIAYCEHALVAESWDIAVSFENGAFVK
jgi:hypothetical protein